MAGSEIEVLSRGVPVARLAPLAIGDREFRNEEEVRKLDKARHHEEVRSLLIKKGILIPGNGRAHEILDKPLIDLGSSLSQAVIEGREDRV